MQQNDMSFSSGMFSSTTPSYRAKASINKNKKKEEMENKYGSLGADMMLTNNYLNTLNKVDIQS